MNFFLSSGKLSLKQLSWNKFYIMRTFFVPGFLGELLVRLPSKYKYNFCLLYKHFIAHSECTDKQQIYEEGFEKVPCHLIQERKIIWMLLKSNPGHLKSKLTHCSMAS